MDTLSPSYRRIPQPKIDPSRPSQRHNYNITDFFMNYEEISKIPGPKRDTVMDNKFNAKGNK